MTTHLPHPFFYHSGQRSTPSRMEGPDGALLRISQKDEKAIGSLDGQQ